MATVSDIITRAYKRSNVLDSNETPDASEAADGLAALNEMLFGWAAEGVDTNPNTLALTSTFPLDAKHEMGVIALLAVRLADENGEAVSRVLGQDSITGWRMLQADYVVIEPVRVDSALANMPSQRKVS